MIRQTSFLFLAFLALTVLGGTARADSLSIVNSNFNGTAIQGGNTVWFSSHMKVDGVSSQPVTLSITSSVITFTSNGQLFSLVTPDARITFSPTATSASTSFDAATNAWVSIIPSGQAGSDPFMTGLAFLVPNGGLPGGINPVSWQAKFSSDTPGISGSWQWGAAVYTNFSTGYNALGVLAADGGRQSGTPINFEPFVTGGARGGGGSNFTGSNSATGHFTTTPGEVPEPSTMLLLGTGLTGAMGFLRKRRAIRKG